MRTPELFEALHQAPVKPESTYVFLQKLIENMTTLKNMNACETGWMGYLIASGAIPQGMAVNQLGVSTADYNRLCAIVNHAVEMLSASMELSEREQQIVNALGNAPTIRDTHTGEVIPAERPVPVPYQTYQNLWEPIDPYTIGTAIIGPPGHQAAQELDCRAADGPVTQTRIIPPNEDIF